MTAITLSTIKHDNVVFVGTGGVSEGNRERGFRPAFLDAETGRIEIARFANGNPAPMHLIEGLPRDWAMKFDPAGRIMAIKASVVSGFVREGLFFTREEAAAATAQSVKLEACEASPIHPRIKTQSNRRRLSSRRWSVSRDQSSSTRLAS